MQPVYVFITLDSDTPRIMEFQTRGRSAVLPYGAVWSVDEPGWWTREPNDANIFAEICRACPSVNLRRQPLPTVTGYKVVELADIPTDRTFRDALVHDGTAFGFDIEKCKEIKRAHLRFERAPLFAELDAQWNVAFCSGDLKKAAEIDAQRQVLRDAPADPRIEAATSTEALKEITLASALEVAAP